MIIIDDEKETQNVGDMPYASKVNELSSDVRKLQELVADIGYDLGILDSSLSGLKNDINSKYQSQTTTLLNALETEINELKDSLGNQIVTDQIISEYSQIDSLKVSGDAEVQGKVIAGQLHTTDLEVEDDVTVGKSLSAKDIYATGNAELKNAIVDYIKAVTVEVENYTIDNISSEQAHIVEGLISTVKSNLVEASKIVSHLYTLDNNSEWHSPIGIPDNTELLEITIPDYDGIVTLFDRAKRFSVTVLNNSLVTYTETFDKLYRIDVNANAVKIYLDSGANFQYGVITIGEDRKIETSSQIVDKTNYKRNVTTQKGVFGFGIDSENGVKVFVVDELPAEGEGKSIYVVKDDKSYYWTGTSYKPMSIDIDIDAKHVTKGEINENLLYTATKNTADFSMYAYDGNFYDTTIMKSDQIPEGTKLVYVEGNNVKFSPSTPPYSGTMFGKPESVLANKNWFDNIHWIGGFTPPTEDKQEIILPTSTTTERIITDNFTKEEGVVSIIQTTFGGKTANVMWNDAYNPYYPEEKTDYENTIYSDITVIGGKLNGDRYFVNVLVNENGKYITVIGRHYDNGIATPIDMSGKTAEIKLIEYNGTNNKVAIDEINVSEIPNSRIYFSNVDFAKEGSINFSVYGKEVSIPTNTDEPLTMFGNNVIYKDDTITIEPNPIYEYGYKVTGKGKLILLNSVPYGKQTDEGYSDIFIVDLYDFTEEIDPDNVFSSPNTKIKDAVFRDLYLVPNKNSEPITVLLKDFEYSTDLIRFTNESGQKAEVATQEVQSYIDYRQNAINYLLDWRSSENKMVCDETVDILSENIDFSQIIILP